MNRKRYIFDFCFALCLFVSGLVHGQITAPGSNAADYTNYSAFPETDSIYIFCTADSLSKIGNLMVTTQLVGTKTVLWEKYNNITASFDLHSSESIDGQNSPISDLEDGCYRATITLGANTEIYRAWVFNNWNIAEASIPESNCTFFELGGVLNTAILKYYDLLNNTKLEVVKNVRVQWKEGEVVFASNLNFPIYNPPAKNTDYTLRVYDKFNCEGIAKVTYESIVTKAAFTFDPQSGEAPLTVNFNNQSENGDSNEYEWYLFRDLDELKREGENSDAPIDSIMIVAFDESPVYTYENSGTYNVKLVSKKINEFYTCVDTVYIDDYIVVDTSFIAVPNVFTPNGDGTNDEFVVQFWSMKSLEISIFNRWGKKVHFWESNDIRGSEETWEETVWDGRLMGGRFASPGVYYYVVDGRGRDDEKRRAHGFFHLFRGKD